MGSSNPAPQTNSFANPELDNLNKVQKAKSDPRIAQAMQGYASGQTSYADLLKGMNTQGWAAKQYQGDLDRSIAEYKARGMDPHQFGANSWEEYSARGAAGLNDPRFSQESDQQLHDAFMQQVTSDPTTGTKFATDQVRNDAIMGQYFGQGGLQDQEMARHGTLQTQSDQDREALFGRDGSFGLTQGDLAAYGQASGNIARQFGAMGGSLAQSLADRGLGASPNGVSAQSFSNLYGNQNEQLAGLQQQIAQNRIQTAMGLAQSRANLTVQQQGLNNGMLGTLGGLGQNAVSNQYARNTGGVEQNFNMGTALSQLQAAHNAMVANNANNQYALQHNSKDGGGSVVPLVAGGAAGLVTGAATGNPAVGVATGAAVAGATPR